VPATVTLKSGGKISLLLNLKREMELWKMSDLVVTDELIHVQASNPPEGWYQYVSLDKKFTLGFPSKPSEQKKQERMAEGETTVYEVGIPRKLPAAGYVLNYYDSEETRSDEQAKAFFQGIEKKESGASRERISSKSLELKGFPGRDFSFQLFADYFVRTRVYLVGRRVIRMSYIGGTKDSLQSKEAIAFFDYLKLSE